MADKYEIDGEPREVEFVGWSDSTSETEGRMRVGVRAVDEQTLWLKIGKRHERVVVAATDQGTWVWHAGRARFVEKTNGEGRRRRRAVEVPGAVTPPMPATVVRILVEAGEQVEKGQGLVVVSAMKMETTLSSPHRGVVEAVNTEVGASVRPGEVLVDVQATEAPAGGEPAG